MTLDAFTVLCGRLLFLVLFGSTVHLQGSPQERAALDVQNIEKALRHYSDVTGHFPSTSCGLQTLVDSKTLEKMPLDPWGHTFAYVVESGQPIVTSYGRDGIPGGEGLDADITSRPGHTQ